VPRVLFVYYTYSQQAARLTEAMAAALREQGCEVSEAVIEFTDERYAARFTSFPLKHAFLDLVRMLPAQLRRATGEIRIPEAATSGDYDLVVVGSPTWWLTTSMPIRSYLESPEAHEVLDGKPFGTYVVCRRYWGNNLKTVKRLGTKQGGSFLDGIHFAFEGGQVRSLLSLLSYLGSGEYRPRFLGVKIPRTNLNDDQVDDAAAFAGQLVGHLPDTAPPS
jgi:menaquinone-dependent protoporphyrinogen IX oxidase